MNAEELAVDDGGEGQLIEEVHDLLVELLVVLGETLRSEVEEGGEQPALVVAPQQVDCAFEVYFECHHQGQHLN